MNNVPLISCNNDECKYIFFNMYNVMMQVYLLMNSVVHLSS